MPISRRLDFRPWSRVETHNQSNRRIRTRTYGGVGGAEERSSPYPDLRVCATSVAEKLFLRGLLASDQFFFHRVTEGIDVANRAVDIGRDAQAAVGVMGHVSGDDAVFVPEGLAQLAAIHSRGEAEKTDAAGLGRVGAVQDATLGMLREAVGPPVAQVAQARRLAVDPQVLVEDEGFGDGVVIGGGMSADFLE